MLANLPIRKKQFCCLAISPHHTGKATASVTRSGTLRYTQVADLDLCVPESKTRRHPQTKTSCKHDLTHAVVSSDYLQYRPFDVPDMPDEDLYAAVGWQINQSAGENAPQMPYDLYNVGTVVKDGKKRRRVIAVIADAKLQARSREIKEHLDTRLQSIDDETGMLARFHASSSSTPKTPTNFALINIGSATTTIMLVREGKVIDARQLSRGSDWIDNQTARQPHAATTDGTPPTGVTESEHTGSGVNDGRRSRICDLLIREVLQTIRVASHYCNTLDGPPISLQSAGIFASKEVAGELCRAWEKQSPIPANDLLEALTAHHTDPAHRHAGTPSGACLLAMLKAEEVQTGQSADRAGIRTLNLVKQTSKAASDTPAATHARLVVPTVAALLLAATLVIDGVNRRSMSQSIAQHRAMLTQSADTPDSSALQLENMQSKLGQLAALRRVRNPLPPNAALAIAAQTLPEGITLSEFTLTSLSPAGRPDHRREDGDPGLVPGEPRVSIRISGWALDEVTVSKALESINQTRTLGEARIVESYPDTTVYGRSQAFLIESILTYEMPDLALIESEVSR
ncbi:MAG: hypothetical protein ACIAXF_16085 [Phycisphaerales bacterium JB063]